MTKETKNERNAATKDEVEATAPVAVAGKTSILKS